MPSQILFMMGKKVLLVHLRYMLEELYVQI